MSVPPSGPEAAARTEWTLIRNARQLLTLQGPSGVRRGAALCDPGLISNGSILVRNGIVHEVGPARRVENLQGARRAREVDAGGWIVMPAFVDAATSLIFPPGRQGEDRPREAVRTESAAIRIMSKRAALGHAQTTASAMGNRGCLTAGARTPCIDSSRAALRTIAKVLRVHQALQGRPLRIRSVVTPGLAVDVASDHAPDVEARGAPAEDVLIDKWLPFVRTHKLATILELDLNVFDVTAAARIARAAAGLGFAIRFRCAAAPANAVTALAMQSAAISLLAPCEAGGDRPAEDHALAMAGCVRMYPAREAFNDAAAGPIRTAVSGGAAIAFTSDSQPGDSPPGGLLTVAVGAVQQLGLRIEEALTAITWNPAAALRLTGAAGSIEAGKPADLVAVALDDYRDLAMAAGAPEISLVMRAGRVV